MEFFVGLRGGQEGAWSGSDRFPESCLTDGKILYDAILQRVGRGASPWIGCSRLSRRPNGQRGPTACGASSNRGRADRPPLRGRDRRGLPEVRQRGSAAGL